VEEVLLNVGNRWAGIHRQEEGLDEEQTKELLGQLEAWRKTQSDFAIFASGLPYLNVGSSRSDWNERQKYRRMGEEELARIADDSVMARLVLELKIESMCVIDRQGQTELDPVLAEYTSRFPGATRAFWWISGWMQEGRYSGLGTSSDRYSFNSSLADLYPQPADDFLYSTLLIGAAQNQVLWIGSIGGKRFHRGLKEMIETRYVSPVDIKPIHIIFHGERAEPILKDLYDYVIHNFGSLHPESYTLGIPQKLVELRNESRRLADQNLIQSADD
ncbi:MAG: hypothetical protein AAF483_03475, partial [Planctomycetota bacterium]